ncbi:MAG: sulfurtransferase [Rhodoferax sp.]|jgi:thiosulfate/3-mercaptopyruvate sulfurtransferase|nr:sulfurtransferase [Rhodoferax sp.]
MNYNTLITAEQLQALMGSGAPLMVFDCSFDLMKPGAGDQQYAEAHIPGAVRADLDQHLTARPGAPRASGGRHPLPTREDFARWLGDIGFSNGMQAVVYDRQGANYCGRLWWMLKWVGHERAALLNGGLEAWYAAGGVVTGGHGTSHPAEVFRLGDERARLVVTDQVLQDLGRPVQTIVDARGGPRFRGEVEPLDPVAGHIPGALNRPFADNIGADGRFKPAETLRQEFMGLLAGRAPDTVVHHCGSGVSAVPNILAMEVAGLGRQALYAGSWSEWCSDAARPCAQG